MYKISGRDYNILIYSAEGATTRKLSGKRTAKNSTLEKSIYSTEGAGFS